MPCRLLVNWNPVKSMILLWSSVIETEKYDAKPTYKKFLGYSPGVAVISDMIISIENIDGNTNVRFKQRQTLVKSYAFG